MDKQKAQLHITKHGGRMMMLVIDLVTDLVNQIMLGVIQAEWNLRTIATCYDKGRGDSLERGNYRALKLTDQILKNDERTIMKLIT